MNKWVAKHQLIERPDESTLSRFWSCVSKGEKCWVWTHSKSTSRDGYGRFRFKKITHPAHRFIWQVFNGAAPLDQVVDHECRNRNCVNPDHLRLLPNDKNVLTGTGVTAIHARKTHCIRGHPFDEKNTYYEAKNKRHCRACHLARQKGYKKQKTRRHAEEASVSEER